MESPGNSKREHDFRRLLRATEKMLHGGVLATHDAVSERQLRLELNRLNVVSVHILNAKTNRKIKCW
eukprot:13530-Eustigmatos_ZCMA.PRE.1